MKITNWIYAMILAAIFFTSCEKDDKNDKTKDTTVNGGNVSGIWEKNSTITVMGHLQIPEGESLTIEEGVTVLMSDTAAGQEILVYGNLYCKGTEENPINITVPENLRRSGNFPRIWSGIICAPSCKQVLLQYTNIGFTGYVTTEDSPSVLAGLYKAEAGEGIPALNFRNETDGKLVIQHCTFYNLGEDGLYLEGGKYIISNNLFYTQGETGGDAINLKSGSIADIAYNVVYSPNTNALKLSNSGDRIPQCNPICYNNTIVNAGWRRPTVKGGGVWLEKSVNAEVYNTLMINCRFAVKFSDADERCIYDYSYYYGYDQETVDQFQDGVKDVVKGVHDIAGTTAGDNDPMFVNYPLNTDKYNSTFNTGWDFHVKTGSPVIAAGTNSFTRHFGTTGLTIDGVEYKSPAPSTTIGALETK